MSQEQTHTIRVWRVRILATTWLSYAGFFFCRKNFAIAKSSLLTSLEITKSDLTALEGEDGEGEEKHDRSDPTVPAHMRSRAEGLFE